MTSKQKLTIGGLVVLAGIVALFISGPYSSFRALQEAVRNGDTQTIERHVDFSSLRASVKDFLRAKLAARAGVSKPGPFRGVGKMLADIALEPIAAKIASPVGIATILEGVVPLDGADSETKGAHRMETSTKFDGLDRFRIQIRSLESNNASLTLLLVRDGFAHWRLAAIE